VKKKTKKPSAKKRASKKNVAASIEPPVKTLTNKEMLKLSTYYGLAIQRNKNSLEGMRKEILAGFYHQSSTERILNIRTALLLEKIHGASGVRQRL